MDIEACSPGMVGTERKVYKNVGQVIRFMSAVFALVAILHPLLIFNPRKSESPMHFSTFQTSLWGWALGSSSIQSRELEA